MRSLFLKCRSGLNRAGQSPRDGFLLLALMGCRLTVVPRVRRDLRPLHRLPTPAPVSSPGPLTLLLSLAVTPVIWGPPSFCYLLHSQEAVGGSAGKPAAA